MIDLRPFHLATSRFRRLPGAPAAGGPAYDILAAGEGRFVLRLAVPGYAPDELDVTVEGDALVVQGKAAKRDDGEIGWIHRGIVRGDFERRFRLAEHVEVKEATLANGLLRVELVREVPEEKKPRTISIVAGAPEAKAA